MHSRQNLYRSIPQVEQILSSPPFVGILDRYPRRMVLRSVRNVLEELRRCIGEGQLEPGELTFEAIGDRTVTLLDRTFERYYRRVINGTGVVLHTNLGRAPLAPEAAAALADLAPHAQRLEMDLDSGERGGRDDGCGRLLTEILECEAATLVNNNAAATLLILAALARGRPVVVSRGELVEIGGSYRVPEIFAESGALLREVGTTNRTHLGDYEAALADGEPALLLKVHQSNYRIVGFTSDVGLPELAELGRRNGVPVVHDLGSGSLVDLADAGLPPEDEVRSSIAAGADLVCFSGDKLLGGPQAGIIAGRRRWIAECRRHPLFRAVRPGRLIYTALEETLKLFLQGRSVALRRIPALRALLADRSILETRARRLADQLDTLDGVALEIIGVDSQAGSGSLPAHYLPSVGVRIRTPGLPSTTLATQLRRRDPAIVGRQMDESWVLDVRTLEDEEVELVAEAIHEVVTASRPAPSEGPATEGS